MFNRPANPYEAQEANAKARAAQQQRLLDCGQMGAKSFARCVMAPATDSVEVQRLGPVKTASSMVSVAVATMTGRAEAVLAPSDARRIGMALIDAADEVDGTARLEFAVDATPEAVSDALLALQRSRAARPDGLS